MTRAQPDPQPAMLPGIRGKTALVTGAGRGIGLAVAQALAQQGAQVVMLDADGASADAAARALQAQGHGARAWQLALGDPACSAALRERIATLPDGRIDLLVNNAGISPKVEGRRQSAWEIDPQEWARVLAVNLGGYFYTCHAVLPGMIAQGAGAIVNVSSLAGLRYTSIAGLPYAVSKSGVTGLTRQLAGEVAGHGIRVNAVAPGRIQTAMSAMAAAGINDALAAQTPLKRLGVPADVADAILFLLSEQSRFITGETLAVTGGRGL